MNKLSYFVAIVLLSGCASPGTPIDTNIGFVNYTHEHGSPPKLAADFDGLSFRFKKLSKAEAIWSKDFDAGFVFTD